MSGAHMAKPVGARARKKLETHMSIMEAALELVLDRGPDDVTVADIAAAADVSISTFFNYFDRKEDAIVGIDPLVLSDCVAELVARPAAESPVEALKSALKRTGDTQVHRWQMRNELVLKYPELMPSHLAALAGTESELAAALAFRLGIDPDASPELRMFVAMALAGSRAGIEWWHQTGRVLPLDEVVDAAFDLLGEVRLDLPPTS